MGSNILDSYETIVVERTRNIYDLPVTPSGKEFEFWYKISNYLEPGYIEFELETEESELEQVAFIVQSNIDYDYVRFTTEKNVSAINVKLTGKFTAEYLQLYVESTSVNVATYESTGIVQIDKFQGVKVEADGKIGVNVGTGLAIDAEGKVTSDTTKYTNLNIAYSTGAQVLTFSKTEIVNGESVTTSTVFTLTKSNGKITNIVGNGINISVTRTGVST